MTTALHPPLNVLATIGDPDGTRTVTSIIALLVALGLALAMLGVWLYRTTRPDPEVLAPLETMGERKWRRSDPMSQRRALDDLRPDGAAPLEPSVAPPMLDEAFDAGPSGSGFDDLRGDVSELAGPESSGPGTAVPLDFSPPGAEATPRQIDRPDVDAFSDDIDPELLATAAAELDAELQHRPNDE